MWKKWHKKSKTTDKSNIEPVKPQKKGEDADEESFELPPSFIRKERNLSISRSGRHKVRKTQRSSVMSEEMYSPETEQPPNFPARGQDSVVTQGASAAASCDKPAAATTSVPHSYHSRPSSNPAHTKPVAPTVPSTKAAAPKVPHGPVSVTGYHCRETVESSTHQQLSGSQRMAHAPTAV